MASQICYDYYAKVMPYLPSDANSQNRIVYLGYALFLYSFALLAFFIFITTKNRVIYSRQKSTFGMVTLTFGLLIAITANVMREVIGRDRYPCFGLAWSYHLPIVFIVSQPIGILYYYIYRLRKERAKTQAIKKMFSDDAESQSQSSYDLPTNQLFSKEKRKTSSICNELTEFLFVWRHSKNGRIVIGSNDLEYIANDARKSALEATTITTNHPTTLTSDELLRNQKKSRIRSIAEDIGVPVMMVTAFGFPYVVVILLRVYLDTLYGADCLGCRLTYVDFLIRIIGGLFYVPLAIMGLYAMRNEEDSLRVYREAKYASMFGLIVIISWIPNIISSFVGIDDRAIVNAIEVLGFVGIFYIFVLSGAIVSFLEYIKAKRQYERLLTGSGSTIILSATDTAGKQYSVKNLPPPAALDLDRILREPKARNAFLEHSVNEISSENVVFVFKVRAWKSMWDKEKPEKVSKIAVQLFKEYISKESKNPINIPSHAYTKLEKNIQSYVTTPSTEPNEAQSTRMKPNKDAFDECENECVLMLEHDTLPRFCQSHLFKTEIIEAGILGKILRSQQ